MIHAFERVPRIERLPNYNNGISRATNAYIEALERELEKEREKNKAYLKKIKELEEKSRLEYAV